MAKTKDADTVGLRRLVDFLGLSTTRIAQLTAAGIVVKHGRDQYSFAATVKNYVAYLKQQAELARQGGKTLSAQRARLTSARADVAEMDRATKQGALVSADEMAEVWAFQIANARQRLLTIPDKVAPRIAAIKNAVEASALLRKEIYEVLSELARTELPSRPEARAFVARMAKQPNGVPR